MVTRGVTGAERAFVVPESGGERGGESSPGKRKTGWLEDDMQNIPWRGKNSRRCRGEDSVIKPLTTLKIRT